MAYTNWSQSALIKQENDLEEALLALIPGQCDDLPGRVLLAEIDKIEAELARRAAQRTVLDETDSHSTSALTEVLWGEAPR